MKKFNIQIVIIFSTLLTQFALASGPQYSIIIDAGSSGSRLHLFQYQTGTTLPDITDVFVSKSKPGLSAHADNPLSAGESLKPLFDQVFQQLQTLHVDPKTVPVSILATAGMRLLPDEKQQAIYRNVATFLKMHYSFPIKDIKTMSGKMEGAYAWLDVNYLAGNLQPGKITAAIIDMGGASTQVAFVTDAASSDDAVTLTINKRPLILFSKSFLGLGIEQARTSINTDPNAASCYPVGYPLTPAGTGNFNLVSCEGLYNNLIRKYHVAEQVPSLAAQKVYAISGVYYTYQFFNAEQTPDQCKIEKSLLATCSESFEQIQREHAETPAKYLSAYCANAAYLDALLYGTYHLSGTQITVADRIGKTDIDWPLGVLLYQLLNT